MAFNREVEQVPDNERWLHHPKAAESLREALAWAQRQNATTIKAVREGNAGKVARFENVEALMTDPHDSRPKRKRRTLEELIKETPPDAWRKMPAEQTSGDPLDVNSWRTKALTSRSGMQSTRRTPAKAWLMREKSLLLQEIRTKVKRQRKPAARAAKELGQKELGVPHKQMDVLQYFDD